MRHGEGKLERRESLGEGEREKKKEMEVHEPCAFPFLKSFMCLTNTS